MTLKELEPGDKFIHANSKSKSPIIFVVKGNCLFNIRHGSATRLCWELPSGKEISKSCRLEIKKVGESVHKNKIKTLSGITRNI